MSGAPYMGHCWLHVVSLVADLLLQLFRVQGQRSIWKLFPVALDKPPTRWPSLHLLYMPGVTKRCRLSLLINSALV
jgi:hypothetical protein